MISAAASGLALSGAIVMIDPSSIAKNVDLYGQHGNRLAQIEAVMNGFRLTPIGPFAGIADAIGVVLNSNANDDQNDSNDNQDDDESNNNSGCDPNTDPSCGDRVREALRGISSSCINNYRCTDFAEEFRGALDESGVDYSVEDLNAVGGSRYRIWSDKCNCVISDNGFHTGTRIGNTVFDNLNPTGTPLQDWLSDFISPNGIIRN